VLLSGASIYLGGGVLGLLVVAKLKISWMDFRVSKNFINYGLSELRRWEASIS
jgi:hypothetical protein